MFFPRYVRRAYQHGRIQTLSEPWRMFFATYGEALKKELAGRPLPGYPKGFQR